MFILELIIATLFSFIIYFVIRRRKFLYLASKIPGPSDHIPLIGILPEFMSADLTKIFEIFLKYQNIIESPGKIWFGPELVVFISTPEAMQKVLNSKECLDKPNFFKAFRLQQASLFGTLDAWKSHRKVLNPSFSIKVLKTFIPTFDKNSKKLLKVLDSKCEKGEFDIFPFMSAFFLETILNTALDLDVDIQNDEKKDEYLKYYNDFLFAITTRMTRFWLHFDFVYELTKYFKIEMEGREKSSLQFAEKVLHKGRRNFDFNGNQIGLRNTIKSLVNPKHNFTDQEIKEEIESIIMAGQETSALTVSSVLLMLAMHKDIQEKVVNELREVLTSDDDEEISFDILNKLPYLEMVIKETMRLFPVASFVLRKVTEDFELQGLTIPAGANLFLSIFTLHRNKKYWGNDAESFIPTRFEAERMKDVHPYAYVPFTGGPRICLGWRYAMLFMKTCLANFLRKYEVDTHLKYEELTFELSITLKMNQPYNIIINKRIF